MPDPTQRTVTADERPILSRTPPGLQLRWITDADLTFLAELYASTRREEVAQAPWSDEQKEAFLRWQFDNQHQHYQQYYPDAELLVVERAAGVDDAAGADGAPVPRAPQPIGRLYVDRWKDQIRLVDISLLPQHRGRGIGGALLRELLAEGKAAGLPVTIHVEYNNPALRLYRRLGFRHVDSNGIYYLMEWRPDGRDEAGEGAAPAT